MESRFLQVLIVGMAMSFAMMFEGCSRGDKVPECYKDEYFCAMLADSMMVVEDDSLLEQEVGSFVFNSSKRISLLVPQQLENDSLALAMADFYNFCELMEAMYIDHETYIRYQEDTAEDYLLDEWHKIKCPDKLTISFVDSLTGRNTIVECSIVYDTMVRRRLNEICDAHIDSFLAGTLGSVDSVDERLIVSDIVEKVGWWYPDFITEDEYDTVLAHLSPNAYLPADFPDVYETYLVDSANPTEEDMLKLRETYKNTTDYDAKLACAFTMLGIWGHEICDNILDDVESFFESGKYSPMLPLLWRAYRVFYCYNYSCPSTFCYVPNSRFNYYRRLIAYTYLCHIHNNPDDNWAKLQYYYLCQENSIRKFGDYLFGNQSGAEHIYLFWHKSVL